jgi:hypothetical protein
MSLHLSIRDAFYYYYYHTLAISRSGKNKNTSASIRGPFSLSLSEIRVVASNLYGSHHTHTLGTLVFITLELILSMCVCVCRYILCAQSTKVHTKEEEKEK